MPIGQGEARRSGHLADRTVHMRARVRPIATAVMALKPMDRTVTQTDRAPSLKRAAAMAPAVMVVRKGVTMRFLSGCCGWGMDKKKTPWDCSEGVGMRQ